MIYAGAEEATPNRGGYSDCQDTFVWRKITFLWKNSKIRGGFSPLAPPFPPPMDICIECKCVIKDSEECSIQCQWCLSWVHGKCSKLNHEECTILCKSSINLVYFCTTCSPNLDELFDDNRSNPSKQISNSSLPEKQIQLENKFAVVETTLHEIKEELTSQLSKCREMLISPNNIASNPPALIANTVYTYCN